ncbi:acyl transferase/acyl hydrolase/lysophospholipase [Dunaliella salina]|uniref:Patatin n=1 Tax=Dunaliella salina TaxID=3046 RepID=A0ABQ7G6L6_DUNSA|nr:acyl transferase/acyl hydrolase/lysophospholipase [Dunaliella salina]|eukprot:KAF5830249.1 acyl transferase/acyl hydrolase/lysophospholipase [Dunaliella salina]
MLRGRRRDAQNLQRCLAGAADRASYDIVLSSGFLAFANHSGFLAAVEKAEMHVQGVMGTSAGALAGSLYCAGYTPRQVAAELSRQPPIKLLRPSIDPWNGFFSLDGVVERLKDLLPPTFEDLQTEFAVGLVSAVDGKHVLVDSGPLPEAVAASAAIPLLFQPVKLPGYSRLNLLSPFKDGGCVDRVGLQSWRERRQKQAEGDSQLVPPALVHVISRSSPFSGFDDVRSQPEEGVFVLRSPQSGVSLINLGDFEGQMDACQTRVQPTLLDISMSRASAGFLGNGGKQTNVAASSLGQERLKAGSMRT